MNKIKQSILAIVIGLVLSAGVSYAVGTWKDPACGPTGCNTDAPINTGPDDQIKIGGLLIGDPILGLDIKGASSFTGTAQFLASNPMKINNGAQYGAVLSSDAGGNATWKMPKTEIKMVEDNVGYFNSGKSNKWDKGNVTCSTGFVRTGCNATCRGKWSETDISAVAGQESCTIGTNDTCEGSDPIIKVQTICLKVGN